MNKYKFIVDESSVGLRLDKFLTQQFLSIKPEITRNKIQNFISQNLVLHNQKIINTDSLKIKFGDEISVEIPVPRSLDLVAKKIDFEVVYEDNDLMVINKPSGLTVHPGAGNQDDTLVNGLLFSHRDKLSKISGEMRLGIVHRLDKDTSGLMIVAKNDLTHQFLSKMLKERNIKRSYLALVYGVIDPKKGVINKNIVRSRNNRLKMSICKTAGRVAITNYETKEILHEGFASLVECNLETGRTHQIRVHLESIKHSIIGDQLYNSCQKMTPKNCSLELKNFLQNFNRQALHSYKIKFIHPISNLEIALEIDLPSDIKDLYNLLKNAQN
ncbi:MAG: RluA family pseudouridine synthase [Proteobacteria bacterium]|nr:RluA family pseudouridine synthase [Pseudomonadota bacterium]NCA28586.1 RluA family pseudouridine synthase [Pseudomonadota bacterium]